MNEAFWETCEHFKWMTLMRLLTMPQNEQQRILQGYTKGLIFRKGVKKSRRWSEN